MIAGLRVAVGVADASLTGAVAAGAAIATLTTAAPAVRLSATAVAAASATTAESPTTPCERLGTGRDRDTQNQDGDRTKALRSFGELAACSWIASLRFINFMCVAFFGICGMKREAGIVGGNFQFETTATYCGIPGVER
jgi:hypothetical protein